MHDKNDMQLITLAREGKREAFGILFERYLSMAQRVARRIVHDRAVAEELAQDAMLEAYLSLDKLKDPARYASWLHGIVRNVCHSYLRRQDNDVMLLDEEMDSWRVVTLCDSAHVDPVVWLERRSDQNEIRRAIERLPAKRRATAALFYLDQLSIREIAQQLDASETAIKSRLFQARKQLQNQLMPLIDGDIWLAREDVGQTSMGDKEENTMVKIDSVHVFERGDGKHYVVCFLAKEALRNMQMWVNNEMGRTLEMILKDAETARPLTHNTMVQMLTLLDAKVTHVEVSAIQETTFYGIVHLEYGRGAKQLDARPSDAITLALISGAPIYVAEDVMEKVGHDLPSPFDEEEWLEKVTENHLKQSQLNAKWQEALSADNATFAFFAQNVCTVMMNEAEKYGHGYVGTEHLLLGLTAEKQSTSGKVLSEFGITYNAVEELVKKMAPRGTRTSLADLTFVPRMIDTFERAEAERAEMAHAHIDTEHLLLGLIAESQSVESDQNGMATQFLEMLGADTDVIRNRILDSIACDTD